MSNSDTHPDAPAEAENQLQSQRRLQRIGLGCGLAGTAFWIFTFNYIDRLPQGDGSGFQWLAEVPLTFVFLFLCLPAMLLAISKKLAPLSVGFGVMGLIAYAVLWHQLLGEFAGYK